MLTPSILYDGTIENLKYELEIFYKYFKNYYISDFKFIEEQLIPRFDEFKIYSAIYLNQLTIINGSNKKGLIYFLPIKSKKKESQQNITFLVYILLILIVFLIILLTISYFYDIEVLEYLNQNFKICC